MKSIHLSVFSETARLRQVVVHQPGPEVDLMVPAMMEKLLFDDILDGREARREHAVFRGVLARVAHVFGRRGYNIESLAVSRTEDPTVSRMTIQVPGDDRVLEQVTKQLNKLVDVIKVTDLTKQAFVAEGPRGHQRSAGGCSRAPGAEASARSAC